MLSHKQKAFEIYAIAHGRQLTKLDGINCKVCTVSNGYSEGDFIDWEPEQFSKLSKERVDRIHRTLTEDTEEVEYSDRPLPSLFNPYKY